MRFLVHLTLARENGTEAERPHHWYATEDLALGAARELAGLGWYDGRPIRAVHVIDSRALVPATRYPGRRRIVSLSGLRSDGWVQALKWALLLQGKGEGFLLACGATVNEHDQIGRIARAELWRRHVLEHE